MAAAEGADGVVRIELGCGLVVRVPGDVSAERAAALVRAPSEEAWSLPGSVCRS
jgi:hypothetical protein